MTNHTTTQAEQEADIQSQHINGCLDGDACALQEIGRCYRLPDAYAWLDEVRRAHLEIHATLPLWLKFADLETLDEWERSDTYKSAYAEAYVGRMGNWAHTVLAKEIRDLNSLLDTHTEYLEWLCP